MRAIAALAVLLALGCAGCGLRTGGNADGHAASPGAPTSAPTAPVARHIRCVRLRSLPGSRTVSVTNADNHGSFCVLRGTGIFVFLEKVTPALWTPVQASSAAVERRPSGVMSLTRGETGAFFEATEVGTARLTSFEPRCPNGPHPSRASHCPAPLRFVVTVHVISA